MKITEPKTPYAKHYDPAEDPSDLEDNGGEREEARPIDPNEIDLDRVDGVPSTGNHSGRRKGHGEEEIPGFSLGEPEEAIPDNEFAKRPRAVHVDSNGSGHDDEQLLGLSPEERAKHQRFEEMRKKHYEMKNVAALLGHPEDNQDLEEDQADDEPPVPAFPTGTQRPAN